MKRSRLAMAVTALSVGLAAACGGSSSTTPGASTSTGATTTTGTGTSSTGTTTASGGAGQGGGSSGGGGLGQGGGAGHGGGAIGGSGGGAAGVPTAADLLKLVASCVPVSDGRYATDDGEAETIPVCKLVGAYAWTADMDVDCDGKETAVCNASTDGAYQDQTSLDDGNGDPLDASTLPYVVIPLPSDRFDYQAAGIELGAVVAVIYNGQLVYGIFGDEGPDGIIGEASYAMAKALGVDPDPSTGGTDGPVTYIVFPGAGAVPSPVTDHDAATALGQQLAAAVLAKN
jgi:hypothetical protein